MFRYLWKVMIFLLLTSCNSPMNHRVQSSVGDSHKLEMMSLNYFQFKVEFHWLIGPFGNANTDNHLLVILRDKNGIPKSLPDEFFLEFFSTMPSMGHPMSRAGYFERVSEGIYINKTIRFSMDGEWQHELQVVDSQYQIKDKVIWGESL